MQIRLFSIMNLNNKTTYISLCVFSIVLLFLSIWKSIELDNSLKRISTLKEQLRTSEYYWIDNLKLYSLIYNNYLTNNIIIQEKIGEKSNILIYRYSKYMCESCMQEDLQEIELFQNEVGKSKVLLLPAYPDSREGKIELSNMLAKFNYENISPDSFFIPSQDGDFMQRYFAVIDKEGNLTMVFFPQRGETDLTRSYFLEVKKELNKED